MKHYILRDRKPVPVSLLEWAEWFGNDANRIVAQDRIERADADPVLVSTVFLGLDHRWGNGPPLLFESLVFGGPLDEKMYRWSTWDEAEAGHRHLLVESITEGELLAWQARQMIAGATTIR